MKTYKCKASTITPIDNNILLINILPDVKFEMEDYMELFNAVGQIGNGAKFYNLIHVGDYTIPSAEVRDISASIDGSRFKIADAFIINSLAQKIVANGYLKINKPVVPTRVFNRVNLALDWLLESKYANSVDSDNFKEIKEGYASMCETLLNRFSV